MDRVTASAGVYEIIIGTDDGITVVLLVYIGYFNWIHALVLCRK